MCIQCNFVQNATLTKTSHDLSSALTEVCLCGAIGQRARLLTERMVVRAHPGTRTLCSCPNTLTGNYLKLVVKQDSCPMTQCHNVPWLHREFLLLLSRALKVFSPTACQSMKHTGPTVGPLKHLGRLGRGRTGTNLFSVFSCGRRYVSVQRFCWTGQTRGNREVGLIQLAVGLSLDGVWRPSESCCWVQIIF